MPQKEIMSEESKEQEKVQDKDITPPKRKSGDPLVYIPDGARLNFDLTPEKQPKTKYNRQTLRMDLQQYQRITGVKNGQEGRDP